MVAIPVVAPKVVDIQTAIGDVRKSEAVVAKCGWSVAMVVLAVTWMAKVGHENETAAIFSKLTEASRQEPGCAMYVVHRHKTEPRRFFIYEQYRDDAALEAHRAAPHFLQFAKKELPRVADRVEGNLFVPLG
jgi:quinol monooxygenase YgiN